MGSVSEPCAAERGTGDHSTSLFGTARSAVFDHGKSMSAPPLYRPGAGACMLHLQARSTMTGGVVNSMHTDASSSKPCHFEFAAQHVDGAAFLKGRDTSPCVVTSA